MILFFFSKNKIEDYNKLSEPAAIAYENFIKTTDKNIGFKYFQMIFNNLNLPQKEIKPKYITTRIEPHHTDKKSLHWWVAEEMPEIIEVLERKHSDYEFLQVVTSPGHGGYRSYAIMKLKTK